MLGGNEISTNGYDVLDAGTSLRTQSCSVVMLILSLRNILSETSII